MKLLNSIFYFLLLLITFVFFLAVILVFTYSFAFVFLAILLLYIFVIIIKKGISVIYPIAEWIVRVLRLDLDRLRRAFIEYNNKVMSKKMSTHSSITAQDIMVLLPHCVQNSDCLYKITLDKLENCRSCGRCSIPEFLELKKQYGVHVVVVSGGTSARELVKQKRPKFLIAVACENDLISGIRDVKGLLVFAILNERPNGPCRDTLVDVEKVKEQIIKIMSDFGGSCNEKNS